MIGARRARSVGAEILPHGPGDEVVGVQRCRCDGRSLCRRHRVLAVVLFLCAGACFYITGRVWALNGSQEM
jgi:hypothetical protein